MSSPTRTTGTGTEPTPARHLGELGVLLLEAGLSVTDVRASLESVPAAGRGAGGDLAFAVLPDSVIVTDDTGTVTMVRSGKSGLSFRQAAHASRLLHETVAAAVSLSQLPARIAQVRAMTRPHPVTSWAVGSALIAGGLAVVFRCPWWSILVAAAVGALVGVVASILDRTRDGVSIVPFVTAFLSTVLVGVVGTALDLGPVPLFAVCAPVAILVPGAVITNALLELTSTDIVTGSARLLYGLIMLGFMTAGISAGAHVTGLRIDPDSAALIGQIGAAAGTSGWQALPPLWMSWVGVVVLALGIGIAFGAGRRLTLLGVAVMTGTYAVLTVATPVIGGVAATGLAAGVLFVTARILESLTVAVPATVSFQPAFLLLVPGTVGLVAVAAFDTAALHSTPATFVSLCIGTKIGALVAEVLVRPRRSPAGFGAVD
ncbi:threonine/serine exporter family protein [Prescottella subtropica]|uniref:threonine/serine exporter family protein n=1 Tax=Prescottella subtropica TaxID=2545757 RepID=UPI0010F4F03C|nr:threonine/serine exporter family protein [Prescottella subtropica]